MVNNKRYGIRLYNMDSEIGTFYVLVKKPCASEMISICSLFGYEFIELYDYELKKVVDRYSVE